MGSRLFRLEPEWQSLPQMFCRRLQLVGGLAQSKHLRGVPLIYIELPFGLPSHFARCCESSMEGRL
jgi:hypothetical protein